MNNSDMPAMPQTWVPDYGNKPPVVAGGLTKREHFAAMAMQGLISKGVVLEGNLFDRIAEASIAYADALLAALEKSE